MLLYKYQPITSFFWKNLQHNSLWFQSPIYFDDEFDSNLPLEIYLTESEIEAYFRLSYEIKYKTQNGFIEHYGSIIKELTNNVEFQKKFFEDLTRDHTENRIGITCFSTTDVNRTLWALYADKGKGVCFKLDTNEDNDFFKDNYVVKYETSIPKVELRILKMDETLRKIYTTKHKDWQTQDEIRLFRHKPSSKEDPYCYKFKPQALKEIIFGSRIDKKNMEKTISIVLNKNKNTKFSKMVISDGEYKKEKV